MDQHGKHRWVPRKGAKTHGRQGSGVPRHFEYVDIVAHKYSVECMHGLIYGCFRFLICRLSRIPSHRTRLRSSASHSEQHLITYTTLCSVSEPLIGSRLPSLTTFYTSGTKSAYPELEFFCCCELCLCKPGARILILTINRTLEFACSGVFSNTCRSSTLFLLRLSRGEF